MENDCGFQNKQHWFRYRAAAIIVEEGCVLFAGNAAEDYLYSVGGAVHLGESAEEAVVREVREETGVDYAIDRLAVIHENFFTGNAGLDCHEVTFYYAMKPRGNQALNGKSTTQGGIPETMHWIPIEELDNYTAYPTFMKAYLLAEHTGIEHIVTDERLT